MYLIWCDFDTDICYNSTEVINRTRGWIWGFIQLFLGCFEWDETDGIWTIEPRRQTAPKSSVVARTKSETPAVWQTSIFGCHCSHCLVMTSDHLSTAKQQYIVSVHKTWLCLTECKQGIWFASPTMCQQGQTVFLRIFLAFLSYFQPVF